MVNKDNIGEVLLKHRSDNKLTQIQVSKKTDVSVQTISGLEGGDIKPHSLTLYKIKKYLESFPGK